jgi:hypothetical protein
MKIWIFIKRKQLRMSFTTSLNLPLLLPPKPEHENAAPKAAVKYLVCLVIGSS